MNKIAIKKDIHQLAFDASHLAGDEAAKLLPEWTGPCGFAWIIVKPGTSSFARWLIRTGHAVPDRYFGGANIPVMDYGQCLRTKRAYVLGFATELSTYFPNLIIKPMSRED
jgi:hypothetical protein